MGEEEKSDSKTKDKKDANKSVMQRSRNTNCQESSSQDRIILDFFHIPKWIQKLEFCRSQRPKFKSIEAAPILLDRSDGEEFKDGNADVGKNQFLSLLGYK